MDRMLCNLNQSIEAHEKFCLVLHNFGKATISLIQHILKSFLSKIGTVVIRFSKKFPTADVEVFKNYCKDNDLLKKLYDNKRVNLDIKSMHNFYDIMDIFQNQ